jgi:hypothetical protein
MDRDLVDDDFASDERALVERLRAELAKAEPSRQRRIIEKFILAALGSIPWIGGFLSAAADYKFSEGAAKQHLLQAQWLEEHQAKIMALGETLAEIERRFEALGPAIEQRIQSEEYLTLVRKAFRAWDASDTREKRRYIANVLVNSAGTRVCSDDVVRLFIDWLELYHEVHFAVIREVYKNPGLSRFDMWSALYGEVPREDSAEADLFRLLIRDLSTGGVIRQEREVNSVGQFVRKRSPRPRGVATPMTMESAFEDTKPYVLSELGKQFVHYTMNEVVTRIGAPGGARLATTRIGGIRLSSRHLRRHSTETCRRSEAGSSTQLLERTAVRSLLFPGERSSRPVRLDPREFTVPFLCPDPPLFGPFPAALWDLSH